MNRTALFFYPIPVASMAILGLSDLCNDVLAYNPINNNFNISNMTIPAVSISVVNTSHFAGFFEKEYIAFLILAISIVVIASMLISHYLTKQKQLIREQIRDENRFLELQYKMLRSQLQPHFIFNALNSIGSSIYQNDKEKSYDFLQQFSKLMRITFASADKINRSLNEEIECVKNYLSLEQFRFEKKLEFDVNICTSVDRTILIPKMIILNYVESAIKNGLAEMPWKGMLTIAISNDSGKLKIEIEDNNTPWDDSKSNLPDAIDNRFNLMTEYISMFNLLNKDKIDTLLTDKTDASGKVTGTSVILKLPIKSTYI